MKTVGRVAVASSAGLGWLAVVWSIAVPGLRGHTAPGVLGDSVPVPRRTVLVYAGGAHRRHYSVNDLTDVVAAVDTAGRPVGWFCEGAILLELQATSGRNYYPLPGVPAQGQDWNAYLDSLFGKGGVLPTLDSAVAAVMAKLGPAPGGFRVALMIPYPAQIADTVWVGKRPFVTAGESGRRSVVEAYVDEVERRFAAARFANLRLLAYYWLNEGIRSDDTLLVHQASAIVHQRGRGFLWIPSFDAPGYSSWRQLGFDFAWLQPNYFFHTDLPATRIDTALSHARTQGMGIEIEFDTRMFMDWRFADRLAPYLSALGSAEAEDMRARPIAIYAGDVALMRLARSTDPWQRALYARLVSILCLP